MENVNGKKLLAGLSKVVRALKNAQVDTKLIRDEMKIDIKRGATYTDDQIKNIIESEIENAIRELERVKKKYE